MGGKGLEQLNVNMVTNPFPATVPVTEKTGSRLLLVKCVKKNLVKSHTLSKDAG